MEGIVAEIEEAFETYDICKMLVVCSTNDGIEALSKSLKEHHHSVSLLCSTMNPHLVRWNLNQFLLNRTRTLVIHPSFSVALDDVWNEINFVVCIDLTEEENKRWMERPFHHSKPHYIHLYGKKPQYYILNR